VSQQAVLVVAPFDDALYSHAAQRCRALERLGCRVEAFDLLERPGLFGRLTGRDLPSRLRKRVEIDSPEFVLVLGVPELGPELVKQLRRDTGIPWLNWFPDDLRTITDVLRRAPAYDQVFVSGSDVADRVGKALARPVTVIAPAADPSVYRPVRSRDQYRANVVFAGAATARRETFLSGLVEFGLALWGPGWRATSLKDYCRGEVPNTEFYVRAYGGASVAVNIHHTTFGGSGEEKSVNQRVFEIAAIGVPQVVDRRGDLPTYFEAGRDLLVFHDAADLKRLVAGALEDTAAAGQVGASARRELLARHTYMHRCQQLLKCVNRRR
jgi:spore maturation protein CgeB